MPASTVNSPELTAEQVQAILVQPLMAASVFLAAGPRIFDTNGSPVRVPTLVNMTAPSWVGENTLIPEVEADFGEVTLLPSTMKSVKSLTRFSNELARQSVIALDAALRDRMVLDVASKLDTAFLASTVINGTEPTGLLSYAGTQQITAVGTLALDDLHDAEGLALAANVDPSRLRWFMRSETFVSLRKLKDADGRYLIQPDPTEAGAYRLLGHGVTVTNRLPITDNVAPAVDTTAAVLADFSQIAVARDLSPSVKILDQTYGDFDQMAIRVVARYDAAPLNPAAVVVLRGITL